MCLAPKHSQCLSRSLASDALLQMVHTCVCTPAICVHKLSTGQVCTPRSAAASVVCCTTASAAQVALVWKFRRTPESYLHPAASINHPLLFIKTKFWVFSMVRDTPLLHVAGANKGLMQVQVSPAHANRPHAEFRSHSMEWLCIQGAWLQGELATEAKLKQQVIKAMHTVSPIVPSSPCHSTSAPPTLSPSSLSLFFPFS